MSQLSRAALLAEIAAQIQDNTTGDISALDVRDVATDLADSNFNLTDDVAIGPFQGVVNITDPAYGAVGDNSTINTAAIRAAIDDAFGTSGSPHGSSAYQNRPLYIPRGRYVIDDELVLTKLDSAVIFGDGQRASQIITTSTTKPVIRTNGCQYSTFRDFSLIGVDNTTPRLLDLSWDNGAGVALQGNKFYGMFFGGGVIGVDIGREGFQGSENHFYGCDWRTFSSYGLKTSNFNALSNGLWGANFAFCGNAIYVDAGSVPSIFDVGFQDTTDYDIKQDSTASDTLNIVGCRTESPNFVDVSSISMQVRIAGCTHRNTGNFVKGGTSQVLIEGCESTDGLIDGRRVTVKSSRFDNNAPFVVTNFQSVDDYMELARVRYGSTPTRIEHRRYYRVLDNTGIGQDFGTRTMVFNGTGDTTLAGERTLIVAKNSGGATGVNLGTAASRNGLPITIKDGRGDAATNNITPIASGGETVDGLAMSTFVIDENYGSITLYPRMVISGGAASWSGWTLQP